MMNPRISAICLTVLIGSLHAYAASKPPARGHWTQKQFLITFWCPPPATDENLARVAAEGFNLTWVPVEGLDVAARHGVRAMLTSDLLRPDVLDDPAKRAQLDALIQRVKNHPAMEAYFLTDEPSAGAFAGWGKLVAHLREHDPAHLAYINLFPTYANEKQLGVSVADAESSNTRCPTNLAGVGPDNKVVLRYREHLRRFVETVQPDLISYDHYHFFKNHDGKEYFLNLALIRLAALEAKKPFLNIIQSSIVEKVWRLPNASEMRWLAFTTLAYGGRGLSYFTYWGPADYGGLYVDGKPAPLLKDVAALNAEFSRFGAALMDLDSLGVYQTEPVPYGGEAIPANAPVQVTNDGGFVLGLFGQSGRASAFMIVNRDYKQASEATLKISVRGRRLEELDRQSGKWIKGPPLSRQRTVKVQLAAGDGRLFRVR